MAKYSFEFKKKVVQEYLNGEGGARYLSKRYNISQTSAAQVKRWIKSYQEFGDSGLQRKRKTRLDESRRISSQYPSCIKKEKR